MTVTKRIYTANFNFSLDSNTSAKSTLYNDLHENVYLGAPGPGNEVHLINIDTSKYFIYSMFNRQFISINSNQAHWSRDSSLVVTFTRSQTGGYNIKDTDGRFLVKNQDNNFLSFRSNGNKIILNTDINL
jgi:hypothetical protein